MPGKKQRVPRWDATVRCGPCHWNDLLAGGAGRAELLGYIALENDAIEWIRFEKRGANTVARWRAEQAHDSIARVGPVEASLHPSGGWGVPSEGLRLRCRRGRHRLKIMKEAELRELIRRLPISATDLYLPAA